ncbi:MAG: hypothetical protein ACYDC2_02995, partial [Solirubrobacteraceae bacterium]
RPNFIFNPTNCGALSTNSALGAIQGGATVTSSPFAVTGCSSLPFSPGFGAASPSTPSRANGASLNVTLSQGAHQANIKSVVATLPKQLPSRLTTLHMACPAATWAGGANYRACPPGSNVGTVVVRTPALPEPLSGPAYLVSHGGAAFPDLDLLLEGDHGVRVLLEGNTDIKNGVTTSTFASIPDVPVSSFELKLPTGPHSALGSYGDLCAKPLLMPTVITAQNGTIRKLNTRIAVGSCRIKLLSKRVHRHMLILRIKVFNAGRLIVSAKNLRHTVRKVKGAGIITIKIPLSNRGRRALAHHKPLHLKARIIFRPLHSGEASSAVSARATFRH